MSKYKQYLQKRMLQISERKKSYRLCRPEAPPDTDMTASAEFGLKVLPPYARAFVIYAIADGEHHKASRLLQLLYGYGYERCNAIRKYTEYRLEQGDSVQVIVEGENKNNILLDM